MSSGGPNSGILSLRLLAHAQRSCKRHMQPLPRSPVSPHSQEHQRIVGVWGPATRQGLKGGSAVVRLLAATWSTLVDTSRKTWRQLMDGGMVSESLFLQPTPSRPTTPDPSGVFALCQYLTETRARSRVWRGGDTGANQLISWVPFLSSSRVPHRSITPGTPRQTSSQHPRNHPSSHLQT